MNSNFDRLTGRWRSLGKLGQEAEQYVTNDPSVTLFKLRLFAEKMTDEILRLEGINTFEFDNQVDKLNKLEEDRLLSAEILKMFHDIRKAGNKAAHSGEGTVSDARMLLEQAFRLGSWFLEHYVENNRGKEQIKFGNRQQLFVQIRPLLVFIPFVILIWGVIGGGTAFCIAIFFISCMLLRRRLHRSGYRTIRWTILTLFFLMFGVLMYFTNTVTTSSSVTTSSENITVKLIPENYDGTIYINDKPVDNDTIDDFLDYPVYNNINVGAKVHAKWTFPWGEMKSDSLQVEEGYDFIEFSPKTSPQLKKQLTDFFNEFAKQCVQLRLEDNRDGASICNDVWGEEDEKLIETGIDFKNSKPEMEKLGLDDPFLIFKLKAYFKYEVNGETKIHNQGFRLVYDETKKSWHIHSYSYDDVGEFEGNPEAVITKFQ